MSPILQQSTSLALGSLWLTINILGVTVDKNLSMNDHVSAANHIRALHHTHSSVSVNMAKIVACALIGSRLDYANFVLFETTQKTSPNSSKHRTSSPVSLPVLLNPAVHVLSSSSSTGSPLNIASTSPSIPYHSSAGQCQTPLKNQRQRHVGPYVLVGRKHTADRVQDRDYRRSGRTGRSEGILIFEVQLRRRVTQRWVNVIQYNTIQYKICKAPCCRGFRGAGEQVS